MKSIIFTSKRKKDEGVIIPNTIYESSSASSFSPRVSWASSVRKDSSSSSPHAAVILPTSSSSPSSFIFLREGLPKGKVIASNDYLNNNGHSAQRNNNNKNKIDKSSINKIKYIFPKKKMEEESINKSPAVQIPDSTIIFTNNLQTSSPSSSASLWKIKNPFNMISKQNNSSLSSTIGTETEWDTSSSSVYETRDNYRYSVSNYTNKESLDSSIHYLDHILEKKKLNISIQQADEKNENHQEENQNDDDDDDTVLVETQSEPDMHRSPFDQLYHYQMNRVKQDRNHIHQRCIILQQKYDTMKLKATFLQTFHESLEANSEPIQRHVVDAQKSGHDIEQFLQGKRVVDLDDSVSEMTMDTTLYY